METEEISNKKRKKQREKKPKSKPSGLGKKKQCKGQFIRRQNGQGSQEAPTAKTSGGATNSRDFRSIKSCSSTNADTAAPSTRAGSLWNFAAIQPGGAPTTADRCDDTSICATRTRRNSPRNTASIGRPMYPKNIVSESESCRKNRKHGTTG